MRHEAEAKAQSTGHRALRAVEIPFVILVYPFVFMWEKTRNEDREPRNEERGPKNEA